MTRTLMVLVVVSIWGCASSTSGTGMPASAPDVRVVTPGGEKVLATGSTAVVEGVATVDAPVDKVWAALVPAYDSLAIPLTAIDPAAHVIGNGGFIVHRKLGNARLSQYINCGSAQGGPSADSYEINLQVTTSLAPASSTSTVVTTRVNAAGKPASLSGEYMPCATTGGLETRLVRLIEAQVK